MLNRNRKAAKNVMLNGRAVKTRVEGKGSVIKLRQPLSTRVGPVGGKVRTFLKITFLRLPLLC